MPKPKITTRLHFHLNGGSEYSMRVEQIYVDGVELIGMMMGTGTSGSPEFKLTSKEICFHPSGHHVEGEEERLDLMDEDIASKDVEAWILARRPQEDLVRAAFRKTHGL